MTFMTTTLAFIDQVGGWWNELTLAKQLFYGLGLIAGLVSLVLAALAIFGMEHADTGDLLDAGGGGGGIFSIKPLTGFFLGFGWSGGLALDAGLGLGAALLVAFVGGGVIMTAIVLMIRAIYSFKSDGTMQIARTVGATGTVYVTVPPHKATGGQVIVSFTGRQETLAALTAGDQPLPAGAKVKVAEVIDGRTVLVVPL
jgi:hypothetical protein